MATRYWVGGSGTWNGSSTANWSTTSGGSPGASAPFFDDVIIDANSGTGTITCAFGTCLNLTVTATQAIILGAAGNTLSVFGNLTFPSGGSFSASTNTWTLTLRAELYNTVITTNGKSLYNATIFANTGLYNVSLGSALTVNNGLQINAGGFSTNNYNVTCGFFAFNNTGSPMSLTLGSSTFTVSSSNFTASPSTNITLNAGTSTIVFNGSSAGLYAAAGQTYYNVTFNNSGFFANQFLAGTGYTISNNLTVNGPIAAGYVSYFSFFTASAVITVGNLISANTGPTQRLQIRGTIGSSQTLSLTTASISNIDFNDITITGAASPISGTGLGDLKGNSGITFPAAKTVYWNLAGTNNWSAVGWATSSGGTPANVNFPLAQDTAVFDNAGAATTVTGNSSWSVGTVSTGSRTTALTIYVDSLYVYGDFIIGTGVSIGMVSVGGMLISGRTTQTITSNGRTIQATVNVNSVGGTLTFADNFTISSSYSLRLTAGTIDANNKNLSMGVFSATASSSTKILNMGSGTWTLSANSTTVWDATQGLTTVNASTSTININGFNTIFAGNGYTYNNVDIGAGNSSITFTGTNTFNTLSSSRTAAYNISFGANQTFADWTANGTAGNLITLGSTVSGTQRTITKTGGGTVAINYISIRDSNAQPVSTWSAPVGSVNLGNNLNWTFNAFGAAITENITYADSPLGRPTFPIAITETIVSGDLPEVSATFNQSITEPISSCLDASSVLAAFITAVSEGLTANDLTDAGFIFYKEISESITLADIEAAVKIHNATAVEPISVSDVTQCFGWGTIDNSESTVWTLIDNRQ